VLPRLDHLLSKEHLGELRFSKREPLAGICSATGQLRVEHYIEFLNKFKKVLKMVALLEKAHDG
jgi:hypothetical protein